jgi:hypothetical protein
MPVQQLEELGGGLGRTHTLRHDLAVFQLLPIERRVVIEVWRSVAPSRATPANNP